MISPFVGFVAGSNLTDNLAAFEPRGYAPGQHGQKRGKDTEYGLQLREKQKVKRIYGLFEKQFRLSSRHRFT